MAAIDGSSRKVRPHFAGVPSSFLFLTVSMLMLTSCFSSIDSSLKLQPTPILSTGPGWVVVKVAYARLKEKPSRDSADLAHIRGGSEFEILAIKLGDAADPDRNGPWYMVKTDGVEGWVQAADIDALSTRGQADYAAAHYAGASAAAAAAQR